MLKYCLDQSCHLENYFDKNLNVDPFRYVTLASLLMSIYINKFLPDKSIVCNDFNKPISKISRELFYYLNNNRT